MMFGNLLPVMHGHDYDVWRFHPATGKQDKPRGL
jgi:hypothetical protein